MVVSEIESAVKRIKSIQLRTEPPSKIRLTDK